MKGISIAGLCLCVVTALGSNDLTPLKTTDIYYYDSQQYQNYS